MRIRELSLLTRRVAEQKAFYCETLGLPLLAETTDSFTVRAGTTRLRFQETNQDVLYHVAFTIPRDTFYEAKDWAQQRVPLLRNREDDRDEIFFSGLNAHSFYFCDPVGNILEYIVHYNLNVEAGKAFSGNSLLHVSEIGLPVEDVPALAELLQKEFAIKPYKGAVMENFAFLGDIFGQLVVVKTGRPWLPTESVQAIVSPVQLTISAPQERQLQLSPYPYTINAIVPQGGQKG